MPTQMRLSEAMRLGSMLKPQGFSLDYRTTCAIQAGLEAIGKSGANYSDVSEHWVWLQHNETNPVTGEVIRAWSIIRHLNDEHGWTREAIADWVATVEPNEQSTDAETTSLPVAVDVLPTDTVSDRARV